jgi:hypothetical protein
MALTRLNTIITAHKSSSTEVYGFEMYDSKGSTEQNSLRIHTTNSGADDISATNHGVFADTITGATGFSFSINSSGNLIITQG